MGVVSRSVATQEFARGQAALRLGTHRGFALSVYPTVLPAEVSLPWGLLTIDDPFFDRVGLHPGTQERLSLYVR